jgi:hypothetical protein
MSNIVISYNNVASKFSCGLCNKGIETTIPLEISVIDKTSRRPVCDECAKKEVPLLYNLLKVYYEIENNAFDQEDKREKSEILKLQVEKEITDFLGEEYDQTKE